MRKPDLPDLEAMQFDELWTIHEQLTKILSDRILGEKRELERRLAKLNQTEHAGSQQARKRPSRRKYPKVLPKYFNPSEPTETWSGRGKQPRWLSVALEEGHAIDEFKIMPGGDENESDNGDQDQELVANEDTSS